MPKSSSFLLGLSHLYGESSDLHNTKSNWLASDFEVDKDFELPVSKEKSEKLLAADASNIRLVYLKHRNRLELPGLEFLKHRYENTAHLITEPLLSLTIKSPNSHLHEDFDNNQFIQDAHCPSSATIITRTKDTKVSKEFVRSLGLLRASLNEREQKFFIEKQINPDNIFVHHHPLFPKLSFHLALIESHKSDSAPRINAYGLRGISLLVTSLEQVKNYKLIAAQSFERDERKFDLAFCNEGGILIEFLSSKKKTGDKCET